MTARYGPVSTLARIKRMEEGLTSRHEFLTMLHEHLQPEVYVETGVHTGESLRLAQRQAIGIDPYPMLSRTQRPNEFVAAMTSDAFFLGHDGFKEPIDLGFVDGLHWYEYAWRDFLNMEANSHAGGVIVFDDVLPYTKFMASRTMVPGDWTGDVWKVHYLLSQLRPDLRTQLVDTTPTGTLMVWNLDPSARDRMEGWREPVWEGDAEPPDAILFRSSAVHATVAMDMLKESRGELRL